MNATAPDSSAATALVTGATSGLGRDVARALASRGWTVLVHGRNPRSAAEAVAEIRAAGGSAEAYVADLSSLRRTAELADQVAADVPALGLLVNNAGAGAGAPRGGRETSEDGYELRLAVNYLAPVLLTRMLRPLLAAAESAQVLNIGSVGQSPIDFKDPQYTRGGYDGMTAYTRSKFALAAFTFAAAKDYAQDRVRVNCTHPATYMDTGMVRESGVQPWTSVAEGTKAVMYAVRAGRSDTGVFFEGTGTSKSNRQTYDAGLQQRLAELTGELLGRVDGVTPGAW